MRRGTLLERDAELAVCAEAVAGAASGSGTIVLIEGAAGMGKTSVVEAAARHAADAGLHVLRGRGAELETSSPYGIVRQLLDAPIARSSGAQRRRLLAGAAAHAAPVLLPAVDGGGAPPADPFGIRHGLFWVTANLAAAQPLLVAVDDVQWADAPSVAWLHYLALRIEELPVALVLSARPPEPGRPDVLEPLRGLAVVRGAHPAPLSPTAVRDLARSVLGDALEDPFAHVCHVATRGNPLAVTRVLHAAAATGLRGTAAEADAIEELGAEAIADAVRAQLRRLPEPVRAVAVAAALLEPHAELRHVAALAGVELDAAVEAVDELLRSGLLGQSDPCEAAHPLLRRAVEDSVPPTRRARELGRAAALLTADGVHPTTVAAYLLRSLPTGDETAVATLRTAARAALARGAAPAAVDYLARALAEPPTGAHRPAVLAELGVAEAMAQQPAAITHLRAAMDASEDLVERATQALALGQAMAMLAGDFHGAVDVALAASDELAGRHEQLALALEAFLLTIAIPGGQMQQTAGRAAALAERLQPDSPAACSVLATVAFRAMCAAEPRDEVRRKALLGLHRGRLHFTATEYIGGETACLALLWIDDLDDAERLATQAVEDAWRMGSQQCVAYFSAVRAYTRWRRGDLPGAAGDVDVALSGPAGDGLPFFRLMGLIVATLVGIDQGRPGDVAQVSAAAPVPPPFEAMPVVALLRYAQGAAHLAAGEIPAAVTALERCGATLTASGAVSPVIAPWRSDLPLALARQGDAGRAAALAQEELDLARAAQVDRAVAVAERALGLLSPGRAGLGHLESAVALLSPSPSRLELGRTHVELGAALRRAGRRAEARRELQEALEIGQRCGSPALVSRARDEFRAAGGRPRRTAVVGAEALTGGERRVVELAAEGRTNREIAQLLFVTLSTVEAHLTRAYRKLEVTRREDLADALGR